MPNSKGPHDQNNAKTPAIPSNVTFDHIIGFTWEAKDPHPVTVYTTLGHFTQEHDQKWNVGWDSYEGWQCIFFGNVKDGSSPHDPFESSGSLAPNAYFDKLRKNFPGHNRFDLTFDLDTPT